MGLIGPNGSGKTTVFNLITGYLKPDFGEVKLRGDDITGLKPHRIAGKGLARTFQVVRPFRRLNVFESVYVICLISKIRNPRQRALDIIEMVGLSRHKEDVVGSLPLGDLKLIEVARALATEPKVLLLDEPLAGVGSDALPVLTSLISTLNKNGLTIVVVEHLLKHIMRICNRVIVLDHGQKIAEGSPNEVCKDQNVVQAYMGAEIDLA